MSTFFCKGFSRGTKCRECCAEKHLKYPPPQYQPPGPKIYRVATEYYSNTRVGKNCFDFHIFREKTIISCFRDHLFSFFLSFTKLFFWEEKIPNITKNCAKNVSSPTWIPIPATLLPVRYSWTNCVHKPCENSPPPFLLAKIETRWCTLYTVHCTIDFGNTKLYMFKSFMKYIYHVFLQFTREFSPCLP